MAGTCVYRLSCSSTWVCTKSMERALVWAQPSTQACRNSKNKTKTVNICMWICAGWSQDLSRGRQELWKWRWDFFRHFSDKDSQSRFWIVQRKYRNLKSVCNIIWIYNHNINNELPTKTRTQHCRSLIRQICRGGNRDVRSVTSHPVHRHITGFTYQLWRNKLTS